MDRIKEKIKLAFEYLENDYKTKQIPVFLYKNVRECLKALKKYNRCITTFSDVAMYLTRFDFEFYPLYKDYKYNAYNLSDGYLIEV